MAFFTLESGCAASVFDKRDCVWSRIRPVSFIHFLYTLPIAHVPVVKNEPVNVTCEPWLYNNTGSFVFSHFTKIKSIFLDNILLLCCHFTTNYLLIFNILRDFSSCVYL